MAGSTDMAIRKGGECSYENERFPKEELREGWFTERLPVLTERLPVLKLDILNTTVLRPPGSAGDIGVFLVGQEDIDMNTNRWVKVLSEHRGTSVLYHLGTYVSLNAHHCEPMGQVPMALFNRYLEGSRVRQKKRCFLTVQEEDRFVSAAGSSVYRFWLNRAPCLNPTVLPPLVNQVVSQPG